MDYQHTSETSFANLTSVFWGRTSQSVNGIGKNVSHNFSAHLTDSSSFDVIPPHLIDGTIFDKLTQHRIGLTRFHENGEEILGSLCQKKCAEFNEKYNLETQIARFSCISETISPYLKRQIEEHIHKNSLVALEYRSHLTDQKYMIFLVLHEYNHRGLAGAKILIQAPNYEIYNLFIDKDTNVYLDYLGERVVLIPQTPQKLSLNILTECIEQLPNLPERTSLSILSPQTVKCCPYYTGRSAVSLDESIPQHLSFWQKIKKSFNDFLASHNIMVPPYF